MNNKAVHNLLTPGRMVILQHPSSGLCELAVVVGSPDTKSQILAAAESARGGYSIGKKAAGGVGFSNSSVGGGLGGVNVGPDRVLWFMVLHQPGPLDPPPADDTAAAAAAAAAKAADEGKPISGSNCADMWPLHCRYWLSVSTNHDNDCLTDRLTCVSVLCRAAVISENTFQGFILKGQGTSSSSPNIPGPLPRYGTSAGINYMITAAPAKQVSVKDIVWNCIIATYNAYAGDCSDVS